MQTITSAYLLSPKRAHFKGARWVRSDHPLRRINQVLDLRFVSPEVTKFYGTKGNVSEDPVVIMKMLLLFLDSVRSERELMGSSRKRRSNGIAFATGTAFPKRLLGSISVIGPARSTGRH